MLIVGEGGRLKYILAMGWRKDKFLYAYAI